MVETENILATIASQNFIGRETETQTLAAFAQDDENDAASLLLLLAAPGVGATEFLRQNYDYFFRLNNSIIPFYFQFENGERGNAKSTARRFAQESVRQLLAYRRQNESLLSASLDELTKVMSPEDKKHLAELSNEASANILSDEREFVKNCLSIPARFVNESERILFLIDDAQNAKKVDDSIDLIGELTKIYQNQNSKIVISGRRRFVLKKFQAQDSSVPKILQLENLKEGSAGQIIENWSREYAVEISEASTDLIANQFAGNLSFIKAIFQRAKRLGEHLDSFQVVQQIYVEEIFGGSIGERFDAVIKSAANSSTARAKQIVKLLFKTANKEVKMTAVELWRRFLKVSEAELGEILSIVHVEEIVNYSDGKVAVSADNIVLKDYLRARFNLENSAQTRALVLKNVLADTLRQAPQLMMRNYRRKTAAGLREILAEFDCQSVSSFLFDYQKYKEYLKGADNSEISDKLKTDEQQIKLPQTVFSASGESFYPPLAKVIENERCAVALGFKSGEYLAENEIVWLAAEVDSKLEAGAELAEFWCDRLEMVAVMCGFSSYQLWLVAPSGFSAEAAEILNARAAYFSSREQLKYLTQSLKIEMSGNGKLKQNEYEMILPMGDDTEMIAARAVEELARRHDFQPKAITQIKTALVEACINAAEHSLSPDQKIYQKFAVENDKLRITVANRGVKIPTQKIAAAAAPIEADESRRGWGLKLMRSLMDEVEFERTDDGTKISMVKYLNK